MPKTNKKPNKKQSNDDELREEDLDLLLASADAKESKTKAKSKVKSTPTKSASKEQDYDKDDDDLEDEESTNIQDQISHDRGILITEEDEDAIDREREFQAYIELKKQNLKENIVEPKLLAARLNDLQLLHNGKPVAWVESLACISEKPKVDNVNDDLSRELSFYTQALDTLKQAKPLLKSAGVPYSRPDDYFAEMLKSDEHMARVRKRLLGEQERIESAEGRRRQRELKKFGKKVQIEKEQEKEKRKKANLETIKKWRKDRMNEKSLDAAIDEIGEKPGKNKGKGREGGGRRGRVGDKGKSSGGKSNSSLPVFKPKKFKNPVHGKKPKAQSKYKRR